MKRSTTVALRIDLQLLDEFEKKIKGPSNPDGKFSSMSSCIRECGKIGSKLLDFQEMLKDPKKAQEFQKKLRDIIQNEQVMEWTPTLSDSQISGFLVALQMEKETRYDNKKLL